MWREDFRIAKFESLIINIIQHLYAKKGTLPVLTTPADFLVDWADEIVNAPKKQPVSQMKQILLAFAKDHNKQFEQSEKKKRKPPVKKQKL